MGKKPGTANLCNKTRWLIGHVLTRTVGPCKSSRQLLRGGAGDFASNSVAMDLMHWAKRKREKKRGGVKEGASPDLSGGGYYPKARLTSCFVLWRGKAKVVSRHLQCRP